MSVTLSGTSPESPSRQNTFAYNQIYGGRLGLHDAQDTSIVGNYIEGGSTEEAAVVRMGGAVERLLFAGNIVVRSRNASPGTLLNVSSESTTWAFDATEDVDVATDRLRRKDTSCRPGVGPLRASTPKGLANALPAGLNADVDYWAIRIDVDHIQLAVGQQEAEAGQAIDLQDTGSGTFELTRTGFPRSVSIQGNRLSTQVPLPEGPEGPEGQGGQALVTFTNAAAVSFRDNELASFAAADLEVAVKFDQTPARKRPLVGWEVVGNRFRGDAHLPPEFGKAGFGSFGVAVSMAAERDTVRDVRISQNTFAGCNTQVRLSAHPPGAFATIPAVTGNIGVSGHLIRDLRALFTQAAITARQTGLGVWPQDRSQLGLIVTDPAGLEQQAVVVPKLFRRLAEFLAQQQLDGLAGFLPWLAASEEQVLDLVSGNFTHFDNVVAVQDNQVRLLRQPEELVFVSAKTISPTVALWLRL